MTLLTNQSDRLYANENPPHLIHESKTIAYDVTVVNVFHCKLLRFQHKKGLTSAPILLKCKLTVISVNIQLLSVNLQL